MLVLFLSSVHADVCDGISESRASRLLKRLEAEQGETALHTYIRQSALEDSGDETETESRSPVTRRQPTPVRLSPNNENDYSVLDAVSLSSVSKARFIVLMESDSRTNPFFLIGEESFA